MEEKKTFLIIFFSFCLVQIWGGGGKKKNGQNPFPAIL